MPLLMSFSFCARRMQFLVVRAADVWHIFSCSPYLFKFIVSPWNVVIIVESPNNLILLQSTFDFSPECRNIGIL